VHSATFRTTLQVDDFGGVLAAGFDSVVFVSAAGFDSVFVSVDVVVDVFVSLDPPLAGFADEYRSAYQPPPFRMKLPPLIWRCASGLPHFGQSFNGSAEIRCSASQAFPQALHTYS
jgi:hypothetical protein